MKWQNVLIAILMIGALVGIVWSTVGLFSKDIDTTDNTPESYNQAVSAELEDKCQTPDGYTDDEWQEHMSHHPDRYKKCLGSNKKGSSVNNDKVKSYTNITVNILADMLSTKDFTLIDTHIPEQAHIPGTDSFIPFNEVGMNLDKLPQDKDAKIVLYCRSGNMSETAAKTLLDMGYTNVYNLLGGVNAWKQSGGAVENIAL